MFARQARLYAGILSLMLVWQDPYGRVEIDAAQRLVRQTRSARPFEHVQAFTGMVEGIVAAMHGVPRAEYVLLQDMRAALGRNDPVFEEAVQRDGLRLSMGFRRVAVLVATQVGRLQLQRFLDETGRAFLDETEAMSWLREPPP